MIAEDLLHHHPHGGAARQGSAHGEEEQRGSSWHHSAKAGEQGAVRCHRGSNPWGAGGCVGLNGFTLKLAEWHQELVHKMAKLYFEEEPGKPAMEGVLVHVS